MGDIIMITGGMRSGKSTFAEKLLSDETSILYIATSKITDDEMKERVRIHQQRRGSKYETYEGHVDIATQVLNTSNKSTLLECVGTLVTNMMFDEFMEFDELSVQDINKLELKIVNEIETIIDSMKEKEGTHIIITNEVGLSLISEYKLGRIFTDIIGRVNQKIANRADQVYMIISGIELLVKG